MKKVGQKPTFISIRIFGYNPLGLYPQFNLRQIPRIPRNEE